MEKHVPEEAVENEKVRVLCDTNVQRDNAIEARRPDIIGIDKKERKGIIIDIVVPADVRVGKKERDKVEKYQGLERDCKIVEIKMLEVMPVVIGTLGSAENSHTWNCLHPKKSAWHFRIKVKFKCQVKLKLKQIMIFIRKSLYY